MKNKENYHNQDVVFGRRAVAAVLESDTERVEKIWIQKGLHFPGKLIGIIRESAAKGAVLQYVDRNALDRLTSRGNHQGLALRVSAARIYNLDEWFESFEQQRPLCFLILDSIQDPGNLGAIIRTASSAEVNAIVLPKHASAPVGGTAMKASAGTLHQIPIIKVANVRMAIASLKKRDFYTIGISEKGRETIIDMPDHQRVALVFGSENRGIRPLVYRECDEIRCIPMFGPANSLNVSSAVAIVLYERLRFRQDVANKNLKNA